MKNILLTGASGYIGKFAIKHLLDGGNVVHAVSSKPFEGDSPANVAWHQADLLSPVETENLIKSVRPTHLLHFAWFVEHGKFWNAPENLQWLESSLHLAAKFVENGGRRMVAAGTCAEYDWAQQSPFAERTLPSHPQTLYGKAKRDMATALENLAAVSEFSFASGKIFFPFGADEQPSRLIPSVIRSLLADEPAAISHGNQVRDYIFVEDIAEAFAALLACEVEGAVNIASGRNTRLLEIVTDIAEIIGKPELLQIGVMQVSPNEPPEIAANVARLRSEVKFSKEFDLRERLKETVDYWKRIYEIND